jgi:hypothetical protein
MEGRGVHSHGRGNILSLRGWPHKTRDGCTAAGMAKQGQRLRGKRAPLACYHGVVPRGCGAGAVPFSRVPPSSLEGAARRRTGAGGTVSQS